MNYFHMSQQRRSAPTNFRRGGRLYNSLFQSSSHNATAKELLQSANLSKLPTLSGVLIMIHYVLVPSRNQFVLRGRYRSLLSSSCILPLEPASKPKNE